MLAVPRRTVSNLGGAAVTPEPTAIVAFKPSLCHGYSELIELRLCRLAARLGYEVLAVIDTDRIPNITIVVTNFDLDAVVIPAESHIELPEVIRLCDVITSTPEAMYSQGNYELLGRATDRPYTRR